MEFLTTFVGWGMCDKCGVESDELMAYHTLPDDPVLCDACAAKAGIPMKGYPQEQVRSP